MVIYDIEDTPREIIALATDYEDGTFLPTHQHQRAQFLYSIRGMMEVSTDHGRWLVFPDSGVWIPPQTLHSVRMLNASTRSLYISPELSLRNQCEVVKVSKLMHSLLIAATDIPRLYESQGRDATLLQLLMYEIQKAEALPFHIPLPQDSTLLALCQNFIQSPNIHESLEKWASLSHKSTRTFSRFFQKETGMTFSQWRQHICLLYALTELTKQQSITNIALSLGYESISAFSAMFKKSLNYSPSEFIFLQNRE
ncbi:AraC family transcriptional regulator [Wohlfahrtiimonas populi]|uniref:AraC family transcriptional regulator n=1 Tax=Wohlfahrtiimonas populi TaxID=1940240 RepID=UPI00098D128C|nr:helix-turn-helix transcriptional regulator [Wohlfahrtiimonas populi]